MATCDFCGASSVALLVCARCQLVSYCDKGCQSNHWKDGGHKERCKNKNKMLGQKTTMRDAAAMKSLLKGFSIKFVAKMLEDNYGVSIALHAAFNGNVAVLELLRDAKVNLETQNKDGFTPALEAARNGHTVVLELLRDAKVNLETPNKDGYTSAHVAAQNGHVAVLKLLRDTKLSLEAPANDGRTPALMAAQKGQVAVLELLRDSEVNLATPDNGGRTPTCGAAYNDDVAILKLLLDAKVNLETPDNNGFSPAHIAAQRGHVAALKLLRDANVDLCVRTSAGSTLAHLAAMNGHVDVLELLLTWNAIDFTVVNKRGSTLANVAAANNQTGILQFLHENGTSSMFSAKLGHRTSVAFMQSVAVASVAPGSDIKGCCVSSDKEECANCSAPEGDIGVRLLPCSRCKLVSYCGKACQAQHWKAGGHKQRCVAVSDRSVVAAQTTNISSGARDHSEHCGICLEPFISGATRKLGCGHELHVECAVELKASGAALVCPICRKGVEA